MKGKTAQKRLQKKKMLIYVDKVSVSLCWTQSDGLTLNDWIQCDGLTLQMTIFTPMGFCFQLFLGKTWLTVFLHAFQGYDEMMCVRDEKLVLLLTFTSRMLREVFIEHCTPTSTSSLETHLNVFWSPEKDWLFIARACVRMCVCVNAIQTQVPVEDIINLRGTGQAKAFICAIFSFVSSRY